MLWWHPRHTLDPAHAWIRARIAEIAAEPDRTGPARTASTRDNNSAEGQGRPA
jgi:hypothetical protein